MFNIFKAFFSKKLPRVTIFDTITSGRANQEQVNKRNNEIYARHKAGANFKDIAKEMNLNANTVRNVINKGKQLESVQKAL